MAERAVATLHEALRRKGYKLDTLIRPDGRGFTADGDDLGMVIHRGDLQQLRVELHRKTTAFSQFDPDQRGSREASTTQPMIIRANIPPTLVQPIGRHAQASLYVRGWAHVDARDRGNVGRTILIVLFSVLLIAVVAGMIATAASGKNGGRALRGIGRFFDGSARVALAMAGAVGRVHVACPRGAEANEPPCLSCGPAPFRSRPRMIELYQGKQRKGSMAGLAVTLVDNHDGQVLWHVGKAYRMTLTKPPDVQKLVDVLLRGLPSRLPATKTKPAVGATDK